MRMSWSPYDPDKLSDKEYEPDHIDQLVEVLQVRAKDIRDRQEESGST